MSLDNTIHLVYVVYKGVLFMKKLLFLLLFIPILTFSSENIVLEKNNTLSMKQVFMWGSVTKVMNQMNEIDNCGIAGITNLITCSKPKSPLKKRVVYLYLDSPGGSVMAGAELIDFLKSYSDKYDVKTVTRAAMSMGFQTVEALGERLILPSGELMSHQARGGFFGEFGASNSQLSNRYNHWLKKILTFDKAVVARTKGKHSIKSYRKLIENEYWCTGIDCVKDGFADRVVQVQCGDSLKGFKEVSKSYSMFFGGTVNFTYKVPNCPLLYPFDFEVTYTNKDGQTTDWSINDNRIPLKIKVEIDKVIKKSKTPVMTL